MTRWFIVIYHRRILTGWTGSLVGLRNGENGEESEWKSPVALVAPVQATTYTDTTAIGAGPWF